ncbi:MAG: hypothetical protein P8078_10525 [bacterium]
MYYVQEVKGALFDANGEYAGVDVGDLRYAGTPVPNHRGSFSLKLNVYRNLNISALCDWSLGQSLHNTTAQYQAIYGNSSVRTDLGAKLDELEPGTDEYIETANAYAKTANYDWNWIEKSDFFKLREISLSYDFTNLIPKVFGSNLISGFILGVSGTNLWTTSKYPGADPDVSFDGTRGLQRGDDFFTLQHPRVYNMWLRVRL